MRLRKERRYQLDLVIVYAIIATAFCLALSPALATLCLGIAAAAWLFKLAVTKGACFRRTPFDKWIIVWAIIAAGSILVSADKGFSFYNYYNLMGRYLLIYYLVVQNITMRCQVKLMVGAMAAAAVIVVGYGFYQYIFGIDITSMLWVDGEQFPELKTRVFSTWQNPNILAGYLLVMMLMVFGLFCKSKQMVAKVLLVVFFAGLGSCLAMTYCRGAWLSLLLVLISYGIFKNRRILIPLVLLVGAAGLFDSSLVERLASAFNASDTSSNMRLGIWESTIAMIIDHPLLGVGWGAYWLAYPEYDFFIQNAAVRIVHAHNMYLNFAAEIGLPGCLVFCGIIMQHLSLALSSTQFRQSDFLNGLLLGAGLALIAMAVNGLTDYVLFNIELSMLFWLLCGIIVIICRRSLD